LVALRDTIESTNKGLESIQTDHNSEVQMLQEIATVSENNLLFLQEEMELAIAGKNREVEEIKSTFEEALRLAESSSKKEVTLLQDAVANSNEELKSTQAIHESEVKLLKDEASSSFIAVSDENSRLLGEKIASVQAEKNKELEEVRSASEEALRQAELVFEIELTLLRDRMVIANDKVQSMRANYASEVKLKREVVLLQDAITKANDEVRSMQVKYENEVKLLRDEASSNLIAVSDEKSRVLHDKIASVRMEKDNELEEVRYASKEALRQGQLGFANELSVLQNRIEVANNKVRSTQANHANELKLKGEVIFLQTAITNVDDDLKSVQAKHAIEEKILQDIIAVSNEKLRFLQEKIASILVEKDKELEEVRSASEEALQQMMLVSSKEVSMLQDRIEVANDKIRSIQANHASKVKSLHEDASSSLTAALDKSSQCDAVIVEKDRELKDLYISDASLEDAIKKADDKIQTMMVKNENEMNVIKGKADTLTELEELKFICPSLFVNNTQDDINIMFACKDSVSYKESVHLDSSRVMAQYMSSPAMFIPRDKTPQKIMYGLLTITVLTLPKLLPVQRLIRKTFMITIYTLQKFQKSRA